ncbi:MAG: ATP-dependent DNA helicase RecG [Spirochaetia bacterium]
MFLEELDYPVQKLKGFGPASVKQLSSMDIRTIGDFLLHLPRSYEDRKNTRPLSQWADGPVNTIVKVTGHEYFGFGYKKTLKVSIEDKTSQGVLVCFGRNFLANKLKPGKPFYLYGKFSFNYGEIQSSAFEIEEYSDSPKQFGKILPIYPIGGNLSQKLMRTGMKHALHEYGKYIEEEIPAAVRAAQGLHPYTESLSQVHFPASSEMAVQARKTLAFRELFYLQIQSARRSAKRKKHTRNRGIQKSDLTDKLKRALPFPLTADQETAVDQIRKDMARPFPMARLLQGDVGSGKTLVSFFAALEAIDSGCQAVFMAPTELLAKQHAENAAQYLSPVGIQLALLTGTVKGEKRKLLIQSLSSGEIDLVIGTHAIFSQDVQYKNLGLVIIDEQHRFGVLQRNALFSRGIHPDLLMMSATPIPRTLALTAFGDLDVSAIKTMPPGRKKIITHLAVEENIEKVYHRIRDELNQGRQAYFVYPLISESDKLLLKNAEAEFKVLAEQVFPEFSLGLIHSKLSEEEKETTMERFVSGSIDLLIATSVVEVGVDVPNATCMVIIHAERFGLSALHQLRGRVGRGKYQSYAFLVYSKDLTENGKERMKIMMNTTDGFEIAEEDLRLRGPGQVAGTEQSGVLTFKAASLPEDRGLLLDARQHAHKLIEEDPGLLRPEHSCVRDVLTRVPPFEELFLQNG